MWVQKKYTISLLSLTETWKKVLDRKGYESAGLMDLSKVFDRINYDFLPAKIHAYRFTIYFISH